MLCRHGGELAIEREDAADHITEFQSGREVEGIQRTQAAVQVDGAGPPVTVE
ncbi:hypothetical protein [Microbacterium sp. K24]|uniref:hypothetical protein n=1 Tax=Microbacterium sp. K24 TaxID=2305446 RepID=UPI001444837D|nr:hypothetical protein [Microbacterium sp. K24]